MNLRKTNTPLLALGALFSAMLLLRCSSSSDSTSGLNASGGSAGTGGNAGGAGVLSVGMDCTLASDCPRPQDLCMSYGKLTYTDPACVSGKCSWTSTLLACAYGCSAGECQPRNSGSGGSGGGPSYAECGDPGAAGAPDGACELPPSVCADDRWLLYFSDPRCVAASCQATVQAYDCGSAGCQFGGCFTNTTTK